MTEELIANRSFQHVYTKHIVTFKTGNLKIIYFLNIFPSVFPTNFMFLFLAVLATYLEPALLSHMDELSLCFFWETNTIKRSLQCTPQALLAGNM